MNEVTTTPELAETVERRLPTADEAAHDPRDVDPAVEPQIGRYRLLRLLGRGGMGVVYTAYDEALDRVVALKTLRGDRSNAAMLARFIREARALARLSHPNIVQIHEVNTLGDGRVFLAMEYVRGRTLREVLAARPPEAGHAEVLELFMQAGRGLEAVHASKLIHRDFKPASGLMSQVPENTRESRLRRDCVPSLYQAWRPVKWARNRPCRSSTPKTRLRTPPQPAVVGLRAPKQGF